MKSYDNKCKSLKKTTEWCETTKSPHTHTHTHTHTKTKQNQNQKQTEKKQEKKQKEKQNKKTIKTKEIPIYGTYS